MLKTIGKYIVDGLIARGATSFVYLAHDPNLSIQLAIKVFDANAIEKNAMKADFVNESQTLHQLSSASHVISFMQFDFTESGLPYIVMPYYKRSLADLLGTDNSLSVNKTLDIAMQVLTGLSSIHHAGLLHRDIKPSNLLLDDYDQIQISDFGISILHTDERPATSDPKVGIGSLFYASPEQLSGEGVTAASDIYSVAALLYRCLTGVHYYSTKQPANAIKPLLSEEISKAIDLGLTSDAASRPSSASAYCQLLSTIKTNHSDDSGSSDDVLDDPEKTRVWKQQNTAKNGLFAIKDNIKSVLLNDGEVTSFNLNKIALLAKAEVHERYSDAWLAQIIAQVKTQLARENSHAARLFLWKEELNAAIHANNGELAAQDRENLIALAKETLSQSDTEIIRLIDQKTCMPSDVATHKRSIIQKRNRGRLVSVVIILACAFLIPWYLSKQPSGKLTEQINDPQNVDTAVKTKSSSQESAHNGGIIDISGVQLKQGTDTDIAQGRVKIVINVTPKDANIVLQSMQGIPVSNNNVVQGEYWLRVSANGFKTVTKKVVIRSDTFVISERLLLGDARYFIGNTDKTVADGIPIEFILLPPLPNSKTTGEKQSRIRFMSFEVTNQLYSACVAEGKCATSTKLSTDPRTQLFFNEQHPVINVSWYDVTEKFIPWLESHTGSMLRLPTAKEWEFAAAANVDPNVNISAYSWGQGMLPNKAHCKNCNLSGSTRNSTRNSTLNSTRNNATMPVRSFQANDWFLYDLHGNVQEWTSTCPEAEPSRTRSTLRPRCDLAIVKGGSWLSDKSALKIAHNDFLKKTVRSHTTGFRLIEEVVLND